MLIAILVTLIVIALILGRTNQYLRQMCVNQVQTGNLIGQQTSVINRQGK